MKKKAKTPLVLFPRKRGRDADSSYNWRNEIANRHESRPSAVMSYVKGAVKKVARVLSVIFLRRKRSNPEECRSEPEGSITSNQFLSFSSSTGYLTESSNDRSTKRRPSGSYQFSGSSRSRYTSKYTCSSTRSWHLVPVIFSFKEIQKATLNFSLERKIGEGDFGTVYKGRLDDGSLVAVKRAKRNNYDNSSLMEFKNEIYTLSKIEHLNLVRLYGFLEHEDEKIIVVEYVGNGNLREHLDGLRGNRLDMAERLEIAIDVAHAITYLHTYTDTPIIHRDIKASNILITDKLRAKVADFGFARLVTEDPGATHISTHVKGSAGYVDPCYLKSMQLTEKSDVYSFGVLLVELVTGRRPIEKRPKNERITTDWAMQKLKEGEVILVMDPTLKRSQASNMAAEKILNLARRCLASYRESRPSMRSCVKILWGVRKEFRESSCSSISALLGKDATKSSSRHLLPSIEDGEKGEL